MEPTRTLEHAAELIGRDQTFCWHPYTQEKNAPPPLPAVGAHGAEITLGDDTSLIDAISSWWVNLHGHGHPYLTEKIIEQLNVLDHVMFADLTHAPAATLAEKLVAILPGDLQRTFFSDNGSTAVETALKIAIQYWHNQNSANPKQRVIAFRNGFHGETFGAMAVSSNTLFSAPFRPYLFEVTFIDPPTDGNESQSLDQLRSILRKEDACCFIFEPHIQGVGGMTPHSLDALSELIGLCKAHDVITIADEIFTGCGRTGPLFATEALKNKPDMICLAKALTGGVLPFGVTVCSEYLFEGFLSEDNKKSLLHGHSYCANPIGCAAALASLDLLLADSCTKQRQRIETSHHQAAKRWRGNDRLVRVDVIGTLLAVDFHPRDCGGYHDTLKSELSQFYLENGIHLRPFGNTIHVLPPYCITGRQLDAIYSVIEESFSLLERAAK